MGQFADDVRGFGASCQQRLTVTGDPEAAIRTPIEHLLEAAATMLGKALVPHSESRLDELQVRPDFAMRVDGAICGYVEVKRPGAALDPDGFTGHNRRQWERLRELPNLLYTNGTHWRLYRDGELLGDPVDLEGDLRTAGASLDGDVAGLERLLRDFLQWRPVPIRSVQPLVRAVAPLCRLLRQEVVDQLARERAAERAGSRGARPFSDLAADWRALLFPTADDDTFADGYAQAVTFSLLLARSQGIDVSSGDLHAVGQQLGTEHSLMGRALQLLTDQVSETFRVSLDLLARVVGAVDWTAIRSRRADAYLHLYEHFLEEYDDDLRRAGLGGGRAGCSADRLRAADGPVRGGRAAGQRPAALLRRSGAVRRAAALRHQHARRPGGRADPARHHLRGDRAVAAAGRPDQVADAGDRRDRQPALPRAGRGPGRLGRGRARGRGQGAARPLPRRRQRPVRVRAEEPLRVLLALGNLEGLRLRARRQRRRRLLHHHRGVPPGPRVQGDARVPAPHLLGRLDHRRLARGPPARGGHPAVPRGAAAAGRRHLPA